MTVYLEDDGKKEYDSVVSSLPGLTVERGYGPTEMESLFDLLIHLDHMESKIAAAKREVQAMFEARSAKLSA